MFFFVEKCVVNVCEKTNIKYVEICLSSIYLITYRVKTRMHGLWFIWCYFSIQKPLKYIRNTFSFFILLTKGEKKTRNNLILVYILESKYYLHYYHMNDKEKHNEGLRKIWHTKRLFSSFEVTKKKFSYNKFDDTHTNMHDMFW